MIENVHKFLLASISSPNVALEELASYYALKPSKRMRPRLILLIAMASGAKHNGKSIMCSVLALNFNLFE